MRQIQAIFRQVVIDLHKETSEAFSKFEISSPQARGRLHRDITLILECIRSLPSGSSSKFDTLNRGQLDEFSYKDLGLKLAEKCCLQESNCLLYLHTVKRFLWKIWDDRTSSQPIHLHLVE